MLDSLTMTAAITDATTMFAEFSPLVIAAIGVGLCFAVVRIAQRLFKKGVR